MALLTGVEDGNEWLKAIQGSMAAAKGYRYVGGGVWVGICKSIKKNHLSDFSLGPFQRKMRLLFLIFPTMRKQLRCVCAMLT